MRGYCDAIVADSEVQRISGKGVRVQEVQQGESKGDKEGRLNPKATGQGGDSVVDLEALEKAEREATPGPWHICESVYGSVAIEIGGREYISSSHDARLLELLRNSATALIQELKTLRIERDKLKSLYESGWLGGELK